MKARTKSALLLLATLAVGVLIGGFTTSTILNQRLDELQSLRERGGFAAMIEELIQPRDEAQRAEIQAVLERSHTRYLHARRAFFAQLAVTRDSMRAELAPLLTPDQQARLDAWLAKDREPGPDHRRSGPEHRPPP